LAFSISVGIVCFMWIVPKSPWDGAESWKFRFNAKFNYHFMLKSRWVLTFAVLLLTHFKNHRYQIC
jgi:hypothetical protein